MILLYKSNNAQWFLRLTICKKKYFKNDINQKAKVKIIQDVVLKFLKANGNVFLKTVFQWSFISCFTVYFNLFRENQMCFDFAYLSSYKYIILLSFQYRHTIRHHIIHTVYVWNQFINVYGMWIFIRGHFNLNWFSLATCFSYSPLNPFITFIMKA